jgi:isocitrate dehydrogenase
MTIYKDSIQTDLVLAIIDKQKKKVLFETKNNHKAIEEAFDDLSNEILKESIK